MPPSPGQTPRMALDAVPVESLPGFAGGNLQAGFTALQESCTELLTLPADQQLGGAGLAREAAGTAGQWANACTTARSISADDDAAVRAFLARYFAAYRVSANGQSSVRFSGYFEPEVNGSLHRTAHDTTPIYGRPHDLVQADLGSFRPDLAGRLIAGRVRNGALVPYFTRSEIVAGALDGQHLEIAWLADPIDALVLEIEGAGRIRLPVGMVVRVAYDGEN
ncbi:MAG: MltA domain-containing protein, partial [Acetobacteraceae bacterium]